MSKIYKQIQHRGQLKHMNKEKIPEYMLPYKEIDLGNNYLYLLNIERPKETFYYEALSEE